MHFLKHSSLFEKNIYRNDTNFSIFVLYNKMECNNKNRDGNVSTTVIGT